MVYFLLGHFPYAYENQSHGFAQCGPRSVYNLIISDDLHVIHA